MFGCNWVSCSFEFFRDFIPQCRTNERKAILNGGMENNGIYLMEFNYFVYKVLNVILISLKVIVLFWNYKSEPDTGHIQTFEMKLFAMKAVVAKGSS